MPAARAALFTREPWQSVCSSGTCRTRQVRRISAPTLPRSQNLPMSSCRSIARPAVHAALRLSSLQIAPSPKTSSRNSTRSPSRGATWRSAKPAPGRIAHPGPDREASAVPVPVAALVGPVLLGAVVGLAVRARVGSAHGPAAQADSRPGLAVAIAAPTSAPRLRRSDSGARRGTSRITSLVVLSRSGPAAASTMWKISGKMRRLISTTSPRAHKKKSTRATRNRGRTR